ATLSKMQSRRQSSKAAADHDDADALVAAKRRGSNPFPRSFGIKATREPVCFRFDKIGHDCPIAHSDQSEAVSLLLSAPGRRNYRLARRSAQVRRSIGARSSLDDVLQRSRLDILHSKVFGIIQRLERSFRAQPRARHLDLELTALDELSCYSLAAVFDIAKTDRAADRMAEHARRNAPDDRAVA